MPHLCENLVGYLRNHNTNIAVVCCALPTMQNPLAYGCTRRAGHLASLSFIYYHDRNQSISAATYAQV
jgi:hypothetical protein